MIKSLKYNSKLLIIGSYAAVMLSMCLGILLFILRIQNKYAGDLVNLRFNVYEGITVIDSAQYVWQYFFYGLMFSLINGAAIWYLQYRFTKSTIQDIMVYWIFGSSVLVIGLLGVYLWLVLRINS
jgi:hypothetical protein